MMYLQHLNYCKAYHFNLRSTGAAWNLDQVYAGAVAQQFLPFPTHTMTTAANADPIFLAYGAFETTAFLTAILVACYSLIGNPKGRQGSGDQSEYQVYAGWRLAIFAIATHITLMIAVIVTLATTTTTQSVLWVAALMVAPWAPLAGRVRQTLSNMGRVRRMMRQRVTRNELAAIIRDRFKFGQRGIALPVIIYHSERTVPKHPLAALRANKRLAPHEEALRHHAGIASQTESSAKVALELGSLWTMNQSLQPSAIPRHEYHAWRIIATLDPLARLWTATSVDLRANPMPEISRPRARARILDIADMLQQGGTINDSLKERALDKRYCERCRLATRGAVEAFLESSERGHTDLRAKLWLSGISSDWRGKYERIIDVMWEACFMDSRAERVDYDEDDKSPSFGDRAKVTTTKTLALLWLIARSILHRENEHENYTQVATIVCDGPYQRVWWDRFWDSLADIIADSHDITAEQVGNGTTAKFKATLRKLIDEDMRQIVSVFVNNPMDSTLCDNNECSLHDGRIFLRMCN